MQTRNFFPKLVLLIFAIVLMNSQTLYAQDDDAGRSIFSATYTSGSAYGINMFYLDGEYADDLSWYTSITAVLPADKLTGADFSMDEVFGQHIGFFISNNIGLGFTWGGSYYKDQITNGVSENIAFVRVGLEAPVMLRPIKEIPILLLPFFEIMVDTDNKKDWDHKRYGVNALAHIEFLYPIIFQIEGGIYNSNIKESFFEKIIESGVGYNWRIGVGIDFNAIGELL